MDPAVITALATFFTALNGWTVGTVIIFVFVVPPLLGFMAVLKVVAAMSALKEEVRSRNEEADKRFEAIVALFNKQLAEFVGRYENNIYLAKSWEQTAGEMVQIVMLNTQAATRLGEKFQQLLDLLNAERNGRKS